MPKVLIADKLSPAAVAIFKERGVQADMKTDLSKDELLSIIGDYDGLAIRSATKVTADVLRAARRLKVIGRAGIGVDNVDIPAATAAGIIVMNTPFGNSITTAEHAIALMMALARHPGGERLHACGQVGKEPLHGRRAVRQDLRPVGCGNIGSIVADRARGLKMRVIAYDPYLSEDRAADLGVEKVELDELLTRAEFISLHTPLTNETRNIISAEAIAKMKKARASSIAHAAVWSMKPR
jgi:D-3-phosphoglycerate dehydrogenase